MRALKLAPISPSIALSNFTQRIEWAKYRVDQLEQHRIRYALQNSSEGFQQVFSLFPLWIHYNAPNLPCYVENAPSGIVDFQPNAVQHAYLTTYHSLDSSMVSPCFDGVYLMGSVGSITQTSRSDLDIWLCHSRQFNLTEQRLIQQKLAKIKCWAATFNIEINFYLMNPNEFRAKNYQSEIGDEHNGSAQHFFLLDEFYRSAIRLGGKRILWLHIDSTFGKYRTQIEQAVKNGELNTNEWIDFGGFSALSSNEFFGAALWQLYKGIKSPYKSAIKILLLESYTQTYPQIALISKSFKQRLLSPYAVEYHFDPYRAMLECATNYLQQQSAQERLKFIRRCFYIKAYDGQFDPERQQILQHFAQQWGWTEEERKQLECRRQWRIKRVAKQHKVMVAQLLQSYRHLLQFARRSQIDPSILPQDTDFLMRQLYSAFEHLPGKIELLNEKGEYQLAEENLTFINVSAGSSVKAGWYVLNHAPFVSYDAISRYTHYESELITAIAWAYFNGLLTSKSHIHLLNQAGEVEKLYRFIHDLRSSFPAYSPKICRDELNHPNEIRNLIVAVNLTKDPTQHMASFSKSELEQLDLFNLNPSKQGIIGSISIIYRNMWNEVICRHFERDGVLWKALKLISNKIYLSSAPPQSVQVFAYSQKLATELQDFVLNLVNRCITVKTGSVFQRYQPQVVQMAGKKWHLVFNKQQELQKIVEGTPLVKPQSQQIPNEVFNFASEGFLQFFFDDNPNGSFNVYVLDKQNKTECYYYCNGKKEDKIRTIGRLYEEKTGSLSQKESNSFNFPQFYQLLRQKEGVLIVPFQSQQHRHFLANLKE